MENKNIIENHRKNYSEAKHDYQEWKRARIIQEKMELYNVSV